MFIQPVMLQYDLDTPQVYYFRLVHIKEFTKGIYTKSSVNDCVWASVKGVSVVRRSLNNNQVLLQVHCINSD